MRFSSPVQKIVVEVKTPTCTRNSVAMVKTEKRSVLYLLSALVAYDDQTSTGRRKHFRLKTENTAQSGFEWPRRARIIYACHPLSTHVTRGSRLFLGHGQYQHSPGRGTCVLKVSADGAGREPRRGQAQRRRAQHLCARTRCRRSPRSGAIKWCPSYVRTYIRKSTLCGPPPSPSPRLAPLF